MGYFPLRFEHWRISFRRFQPGAMDVYSKMARGWVGTAPAKYMQRSFEDWLAIFGLGFQWSLRFQGKKIDCLVSISSVGTLVRLLLLYNNQSWILLSEVGFSNSFLLMSSCLPQIFVVFFLQPCPVWYLQYRATRTHGHFGCGQRRLPCAYLPHQSLRNAAKPPTLIVLKCLAHII